MASGLMGCSAILAFIPAVELSVVIAGAIPAGITIVLNKAQIEEKKERYRAQHRNMKVLL